MKILHVITGLEVGGAEMMLVKTLPELSDFEHTVCTILSNGPLAKPLEEAGIRVVSLNLKRDGLIAAVRAFRKLAQEKPDLCISYLIHADLFVRLLAPLFGIRRQICFIRNNLIGSKYDRLLRLERLTQGLVTAYFSVSASVAEAYITKRNYPRHKFTVIPNGLDPRAILAAKPLSRAELDLENDQEIVLMVGKFFAQKGHRFLFEAWSQVVAAHPKAVLLLAGAGPLEAELKALAKPMPSIRFLGVRSDVPPLLKTADIFVFPTLFEGMSNALLEAMTAGAAIVTTNIPENLEVAPTDAVRYVAPSTVAPLAEAIIALLEHPEERAALGAKAKHHVLDTYRIEHTVAKLRDAYHSILSA